MERNTLKNINFIQAYGNDEILAPYDSVTVSIPVLRRDGGIYEAWYLNKCAHGNTVREAIYNLFLVKRVYIVTALNDDSYIAGVFTTREKATDFINSRPASNKLYTIEEYELE